MGRIVDLLDHACDNRYKNNRFDIAPALDPKTERIIREAYEEFIRKLDNIDDL
jgi:hypothetical protein